MNTIKKTIFLLLALFMVLPIQSLLNSKEAGAATSGVPPAACTRTLTGTSSVPKVTLSPKPLDLVFILDASGSFTANMPIVKTMINQTIDKYVQPEDGDRAMVTTFQGTMNHTYASPNGTQITLTENNFKISTNNSKLTSNISEVKNFVNGVSTSGSTPTPSGVEQAKKDYQSVAGNATGRQTVFVLITDGVVNVNPLTKNIEKDAAHEQTYVDLFKSVSTKVGTYYDSVLRQYFDEYSWKHYDYEGKFVAYERIRDYPGTQEDKFQDSIYGNWYYIKQYETSQKWEDRLVDLRNSVYGSSGLLTAYPNAELVVGYLEDRKSLSNINLYGPLYEATLRPAIQQNLQSLVTDPSYYINTTSSSEFVTEISAAINNAVQSVQSTGTFTLTDGYKMETMTLVNKTTGERIPLSFTQNGTAVTINQFEYDGQDYSLEFTTSLVDPSKLVIDSDPSADEVGPVLDGSLTMGTVKTTIPKFGPSKGDVYQYFNCEATVKKSVKKASESTYNGTSTTLDNGSQTFSFANDYTFNRAPLSWTGSPVLYDKIDPRLEILDVKVVATDSTGTVSTPFTLGSGAITTTNNEVRVTLPKDADGKFTSYLRDAYKVIITTKIKPQYVNDTALYNQIVNTGIPNQAELLTYIPFTTTLQSLISNEVKVFAPNQTPIPLNFQKNGVNPAGVKSPLSGAEFKLTPVSSYIDSATGLPVQVNAGNPMTVVSDAAGKVIFPNLMPGDYLLEETKSPEGFKADTVKRKITLNANGTYTVKTIAADGKETAAPYPLVVDNTQLKVDINIDKQSDVTSVTKVGDVITYKFIVKNTGETTLKDVTVTDPMFPTGITLAKTELAPGESTEGTIKKTATQADINGGDIVNTATATGNPPGTIPPPKHSDTVTITTPDTPKITLDKAANVQTVKEGDTVTYSFTVKNEGNVTLTNVTLNDPKLNGNIVLAKQTLLPGETTTGTATYKVTPDDVKNPTIVNTATVTGTPPTGTNVTAKDTETITPVVTPGITLDKSTLSTGISKAGEEVTYQFKVTNTGNTTLTNVNVKDPMFSTITLAKTTLAPGESTTGTAKHTVTQAELDSGSLKNVATATGTPPSGPPPTSTDDVILTSELVPSIKLEKNTATTSVKEGDTVTYDFKITNTGNTTLQNITLNDPMLGGNVTIQKTTLAPNETTTGTATYKVTTADMAKDTVPNTATVNGTDLKGTKVTDADDASVTPDGKPGINLDKATSTLNVTKAGDIVKYTFKVTNTGDTTLTNVKVTDPMFASITLGKTTLAPGESTTATAEHAATQKEIDAGKVFNKATATGTPPTGTPPTSTDEVTVPTIPTTAIEIDKISNVQTVTKAGDVINYTFNVKNTGTSTLTDVKITDPMFPDGITVNNTTLAPGQSTTATANHTVTQAEINAGLIHNTATVIGTPPGTLVPPTDTDDVDVTADPKPGILLDKEVVPKEVTKAGQILTYTFKVTNTGNTTLSNVKITDKMFPGGITLEKTTLQPGETTTGTATHEVTQAEFDSGNIKNIATVTGTPPSGPPPTSTDEVEVPTKPTTSISIDKKSDRQVIGAAGQDVEYTFVVTNTGTSTLTDVVVTDKMFPEGIKLAKTTLLPGESTVATANHIVTPSEFEKATLDNTASVTGTPPDGLEKPTAEDEVKIPTERKPGIEIHKNADVAQVVKAGDIINYKLTVVNTGNVTLTDVKVTDPMFSQEITLPATTLKPGEETSVTLTHTVTQAEINSGSIENTASTTGTPPAELTPPKDDDKVIVPVNPTTAIEIDKTSNVSEVTKAGDEIVYKFVITNTGTVTLTDIKLDDEKLGGSISVPTEPLQPGKSVTVEKTYKVTQADINAGKILNTATTTGTPPGTLTPPTDSDEHTVNATGTPGIEITKTPSQTTYKLGDVIKYSFLVSNTGNVTLTDVDADDLGTGQHIHLDKEVLEPGETTTATLDYTITQKDVDAGQYFNQAVVQGTPPGDLTPPTDDDDVTITTDQSTSIDLEKTANKDIAVVGEEITYSFEVTNTGTVTLTDVTLNDPMFGGPITLDKTTLAPGEKAIGTATKTVTQADIDGGSITNTADVTGTPPGTLLPPTDTDTVKVPVPDGTTSIDLVKTAAEKEVHKAGDEVNYSFTVTNTGSVTLKNVVITDEMFPEGITLDKTTLAPGEKAIGTVKHIVTEAEIASGEVVNIAKVTGTPPGDRTPPTDEDKVIVPVNVPSVSLDKSADKTTVSEGDTVTYTFKITNTGKTTLNNIKLNDDMLGGDITVEPSSLEPGESATATAIYVVKDSDMGKANIINNADVIGTSPAGTEVTAKDTETIVPNSATSIDLEKSTQSTSFSKVGDTVTYTFDVTNTGSVTLKDVVVTDAMFPEGITLDKTTLKAGETTQGTAVHTVTQADLDKGYILNVAKTTGTPPGDITPPEDTDEVTVPAIGGPAISLDKSADKASFSGEGEKITYTFKITNTGNVTLTDVVLEDPMFENVKLEQTTLAPGESTTGTATYKTTDANVKDSKVFNKALATGTPPAGMEKPASTDEVTILLLGGGGTPTTEEPTTEAPTTETPTTEVPTTEKPTTETPSTEEPTTEKPTTEAPTTEAPTTEKPTTEAPTTEVPTTEAPTTEMPVEQKPAVSLEKTAEQTEFSKAGDTIQYHFVVTNNGNVKLTEVKVMDPLFGGNIVLDKTTLEPGEKAKGTATYVVTEADVQNGKVYNKATATGTPPEGLKPPEATDEVTVPHKGGGGTPTTEEPTTEKPTTEAPTTEKPTTEKPTTEAPTTEKPTTEAPTTEKPTTEAPTTEKPTTEAPTTEAPTTEKPTTEAPTTEAPTTEEPTTETPVVVTPPTKPSEPTVTPLIPSQPDQPATPVERVVPVPGEDLPDTGEALRNTGLMATLAAMFGGALLFVSRRREEK